MPRKTDAEKRASNAARQQRLRDRRRQEAKAEAQADRLLPPLAPGKCDHIDCEHWTGDEVTITDPAAWEAFTTSPEWPDMTAYARRKAAR